MKTKLEIFSKHDPRQDKQNAVCSVAASPLLSDVSPAALGAWGWQSSHGCDALNRPQGCCTLRGGWAASTGQGHESLGPG